MRLLSIIFFFVTTLCLGQHPIGVFEDHIDIGKPSKPGTAVFDKASNTYTLQGSGKNIWFSEDEFQYAYKSIKGDFILTANFGFVGQGMNHRKIGWMVRASPAPDAVHYSAVLHGDGLTVLQWRPATGASMRDPQDEIFAPEKNYTMMQLERTGNKIIMRAAMKDGTLKEIGSTVMQNMPSTVMAGIFVCAHEKDVMEEAKISNVKIVEQQ